MTHDSFERALPGAAAAARIIAHSRMEAIAAYRRGIRVGAYSAFAAALVLRGVLYLVTP